MFHRLISLIDWGLVLWVFLLVAQGTLLARKLILRRRYRRAAMVDFMLTKLLPAVCPWCGNELVAQVDVVFPRYKLITCSNVICKYQSLTPTGKSI